MRSRLAFFLAVAFATALLLTACRVAPPGDALVQRLDAATQRALVFTSAGIGSIRPHVRVRNVGEPGSEVRVTMELPPGMSASLASATLRAGEFVDITLAASGPSRDAIVVVRTDGRANAVPVRVVADDGVICAPGSTVSSADTLGDAAAFGASTPPPAAEPEGLEVVVTYASEALRATSLPEVARRQVADRALSTAAARLVRPGGLGEHDLVVVPDAAALERLRRAPGVRHVAPNVQVHRSGQPNDPYLEDQWWIEPFGIAAGWAMETGTGPDEIVVAIVDDGVNTTHVDLIDKVIPGCDVFEFDGDVSTTSNHGSHVAGLAAAAGNNLQGIAGVGYGPAIRVLPVKVFPVVGNTTLDHVLRGMRWSAGLHVSGLALNQRPADVINMSLGVRSLDDGGHISATINAVIDEIYDHGPGSPPVLIAAAGNDPNSADVDFPARVERVIAVGSVDYDRRRSGFSTFGEGLTVMAPGGNGPNVSSMTCWSWPPRAPSYSNSLISLGAQSQSNLDCSSGTSMAAPIVSGTVALAMIADPTLKGSPTAVTAILLARAFRPAWWSEVEYGAGIVCLDAVLGAATACGE